MKNAIVAAAVIAAFTGPVSAADLILAEPPGEVGFGFDWGGFYAGLTSGYGFGTTHTLGDVLGNTDDIPAAGALAGVTLGMNSQFSNFVLGAEGDILWSGMNGSVACAAAPAFSCNAAIQWLGSLRARAGISVDKLLFFATAGLSAGGGTGTITPTFPGTTSNFSDVFVGWTAGAGAEVAINETMSLKAEYAFYNLGSRTAAAGVLGPAQTYTVSPVVHAVKVGLNFHF